MFFSVVMVFFNDNFLNNHFLKMLEPYSKFKICQSLR